MEPPMLISSFIAEAKQSQDADASAGFPSVAGASATSWVRLASPAESDPVGIQGSGSSRSDGLGQTPYFGYWPTAADFCRCSKSAAV
jgi:hypothetical protein